MVIEIIDGVNKSNNGDMIVLTDFADDIQSKNSIIVASALYGRINNTKIVPVKLESSTQDLQTIEQEHAEIHSGDHYNYCDYSAAGLGSGATVEILMTTGDTDKLPHLVFEAYSVTGATLELFEGVSGVVGGTVITPRNNNRVSTNTSNVTMIKDPSSIASDGTRAAGFLVGAGRNAGFASRSKENILKKNTTYMIRVTSLASSNRISWCADWYEHTDKNP
jgi:hypothetical protein